MAFTTLHPPRLLPLCSGQIGSIDAERREFMAVDRMNGPGFCTKGTGLVFLKSRHITWMSPKLPRSASEQLRRLVRAILEASLEADVGGEGLDWNRRVE